MSERPGRDVGACGPSRRRDRTFAGTYGPPAGSFPRRRARPLHGWGPTPSPRVTSLRFGRTADGDPFLLSPERSRPLGRHSTGAAHSAARGRQLHHAAGLGERGRRDAVPDLAGAQDGAAPPPPASSTGTAPMSTRSIPRSPPTGSPSSTVAWSTPWPTSAVVVRWAGHGTRTADGAQGEHVQRFHRLRQSTGGGGDRPTRCGGRSGWFGRRDSSSAPWPTRHPNFSRRWWRRSPLSTSSPRCSTPTSPSPSENGRSGATRRPTRRPTSACSPTRRTTTSRAQSRWSPRTYPEPPGHRRSQRSSGQLLGAREVGGENPVFSPSTRVLLRTEMGAGHGGPSGPLRRLEGGGARLRLPARRIGHAAAGCRAIQLTVTKFMVNGV